MTAQLHAPLHAPLFCDDHRAQATHRPARIPDVPRALGERYDVSGPRYTSYPPVPDWTGGVTADRWAAQLRSLAPDAATGERTPLALYMHLPFCVSRCLYCGCNATVTTREEVVEQYLRRLRRELHMLRDAIGARPRISAMHWGGGTPNFLTDRQFDALVAQLDEVVQIDRDTECSIEADPRLVTRAQLRALARLGFQRISYGVQDLDPVVQEAIGRVQPESLVRDAVIMAREEGFSGLNVDLIYGLPHQTPDRFARTLEGVVALGPDRIACFGYAHVPWMRAHQRRIETMALPVSFERLALFRQAVARFVDAGYAWIGLDHFARPDDPLAEAAANGTLRRDFMGYTTRVGSSLLGVGVSSISEVHGWHVQNTAHLGEWQRAIDGGALPVHRGHICSPDDTQRSTAIAHLLCNAALPYALIPGDRAQLRARWHPFIDDGLVVAEADQFRVTTLGRFFLRNLAFTLDAYRDAPGDADGAVLRFSRAV